MVQKRYKMDKGGNDIDIGMEAILLLLRGERHLRGIAKELGWPHSTVMRRLNVLVSENVLDFKQEGKNKVFSIKDSLQAKNLTFNAERYKLLKLFRKYPDIVVIADGLMRKLHDGMIVLFGSYARFSAKKGSDIDVYIGTSDKKAKEIAESLNSRINAKIGSFDTNSYLIREIIKNHVIIRGVEEFYEKAGIFG